MPPRKACDGCFKRKIRCLLPEPGDPCDWCKNQGIKCTFLRESHSSQRLSPAAVRDLLSRVDQLEAELARRNAKSFTQPSIPTQGSSSTEKSHVSVRSNSSLSRSNQPTPSTPHESPYSSDGPYLHPQHRKARPGYALQRWIGSGWFFRGVPILSSDGEKWLSAKTGQHFSFQSLSLPIMQKPRIRTHERANKKLPDESNVRELAKTYFRSRLYQTSPILDPFFFEETINIAYAASTNDATCSRSASSCIASFYEFMRHSFAENFHDTINQPAFGGKMGNFDLCADELNVYDLQSLLLMITFDHATQNPPLRHRLLSVACQGIIDMKGHLQQPYSEQESNSISDQGLCRYIRGLFWLCYRLDKDIALRHGRPPILAQEHCDLTLPNDNNTSWLLPDQYAQSMMGPFLSASSLLSVIKENVCRLLFPSPAAHTDDHSILLNIRHLDEELERWRTALPQAIQPKLSIDGDGNVASPPNSNSSRGDWALALQLDYGYTFIMIHSAIRKCGRAASENEDVPEDLHQVIHSSINLSLEAARSTLKLLGDSATTDEKIQLPHMTSYIPPSAFALFLNIVIHPFDQRGPQDLALLTNFTGKLQGIELSKVTDENMNVLQSLCDFLMELVRLGNSAIWQAKRGARR